MFGEPRAFHVFAPSWQPLFWNLAEQSASTLLASENNWLQMMAVLRVEHADANTFREVFTEALQQVKKIKGDEHVRWYDLMRIMLSWVYWRRTEAERPALLKAAEAAQVSVRRKGDVQQMESKLGPSFWDLAMERATELAQKQVQQKVREEAEESWRKGLAQGRAEGLAEWSELGKLASLRDILKTLLQDQFGRLPKKLQKQIDTTDNADQLRNAIRNAHRCPSLREFQL
jgi:hypothetical protein